MKKFKESEEEQKRKTVECLLKVACNHTEMLKRHA